MRCLAPLAAAGLLLAALPSSSDTWTVTPAGDGDFATISAALSGAGAGDIIELTDGVFSGAGNHDVWVGGSGMTLRSQSGDASVCTIDVGGGPGVTRRAFAFQTGGTGFTLENITITGATALDEAVSVYGGAIVVNTGSAPTIRGCVFRGNQAHRGGAVFGYDNSSPDFTDCVFVDNWGEQQGGAVAFNAGCTPAFEDCVFDGNTSDYHGGAVSAWNGAAPTFTGCTFFGNSAPDGGGVVWCRWGGAPVFVRSILAFSGAGGAVGCDDLADNPTLSCSNVFGNAGGDWAGCIAGQEVSDGNMSADPLFCDAVAGDLRLQWGSGCLPAHSDGCGTVGRFGPGNCVSLEVEPVSWGQVKASYR